MARSPRTRGAAKASRASVTVSPGRRAAAWTERVPAAARPAVIVLFVAAALPVLLWMHPVGDYFTETDFYGGYAPGVHALWAHGLDPARYGVVGPVYELLLGLLGKTGLDLFRLAQSLSLAGAVATLTLWSGWLERRFGRAVGVLAALFMATNPTFFRYAYTACTDAPYLGLASAGFVSLFPSRPRLRFLALGGLLAALATLTRYTGIVLVALGLLVPLAPAWRGRRLRAALAVFGGALVVFAPWWAFTLTRGAPPTLRFYHNLAYEVYARSRGITWDTYQETLESQFPTLQSVITKDPGAVVSRLFANTFMHAVQAAHDLWLPPLTALGLLGLVGVAVGRPRGALPIVAYFAVVYASLIPAFYANRYHLPLVPAAAALAALALAGPGAWLAGGGAWGRGRVTATALAGAALALFVAAYSAQATAKDARWLATQVPTDVPPIGRALKADWSGPGRPRLIARKPHLSYYADAVAVSFVPATNLESLGTYARTERADYLFMSWPEAELRPAFAFLLVPEFAPPGLDLVAADPKGHSALYRVRPEFGRTLPAWYPREWEWRAAEGMARVRPTDPKLWLATGEGRHARRDFAGAHEAYDLALQLHPNWGMALFDRANLDADEGRLYDARAGYEAALAAGEGSPRLLAAYALTLARLGDRGLANQVMQRYVEQTHDTSFLPALDVPPAGAPPGTPPAH